MDVYQIGKHSENDGTNTNDCQIVLGYDFLAVLAKVGYNRITDA